MERTCGTCGAENPPEARFCNACGSAVEVVQPRLERKYATVLFADLVGYTGLTEGQDPELVRSILSSAFDRFVEVIERHGGVVEKFIGDAVLATFGIPTAHEDDPARGVRTGLELQAAVRSVNAPLRAESKPQIAVRIGVEAGEVLVDLERVATSRERMLTGDTVNLAARLQQAAEPDMIVIGPNVHLATSGLFDYRALPRLQLKGKAQPTRAWELLGSVSSTRERRAPLGLTARMIGRDSQMLALEHALDRARTSRTPVLATVVGEPGVGKSRMAAELASAAASRLADVRWLHGRCLAYGNLAYSALGDAIKTYCGIAEDDGVAAMTGKVARGVRDLFGDADLAPHLEVLVGTGLQPALTREELFGGWRRFLERIAETGPIALVLEDVHWADEGLLDFIEHLAAWGNGPILILALSRPELLERRPDWASQARAVVVHLDVLGAEEVAHMLEDLLAQPLPTSFTGPIATRSEGNPLFAEEMVRMLVDQGVLRRTSVDAPWDVGSLAAVELPKTVHGVIAARIDALPGGEKAVLQDAAVIGRIFWAGALARLSGATRQDLTEPLDRLRAAELVLTREPSTFSGDNELAFRHVFIRDVAYEALPKASRARKHLAAADWALAQAGERADDLAELIATHFVQAVGYLDDLGERGAERGGVDRAALRWSRSAGQHAVRLWQPKEAVHWFRTSLDLAERNDLEGSALAELWESYASACESVEPYPEVTRALERARLLYEEAGAAADVGRVDARLAYIAYQSGQETEITRRAGAALARLEPLGDSGDLALALSILGQYHRRRGQWAEARDLLRRAMDMAERVGEPVTQGRAMVWLGSVLQAAEGAPGIALLERSVAFAREQRDLSLLLRAMVELSEAYEQVSGDYRAAERLLREGITLAEQAGSAGEAAWMAGNLADYLLDLGRLDKEVEALARRGFESARAVGEVAREGYSLCAIALIQVTRDELSHAEPTLAQLAAIIGRWPDPYMEGWAAYTAGLLDQARGRELVAADTLSAGARRLGDRIQVWGGQNLLLEAVRCLIRVGRREEALPLRERLAALAARSTPARAFLAWADGLLDPTAESARSRLADAVEQFRSLGRQLELGRSLVELAVVERSMGADGDAALEEARSLFEASGARLFQRLAGVQSGD